MILPTTKKTHTEISKPRMSVARLADYMAASEQSKRSIVQSCKYRSTARVIQHDEAKVVAANYLHKGVDDLPGLLARAEFVRNKLTDNDFDAEVNDFNASYIERFAAIVASVDLPKAEIAPAHKFPPIVLNSVTITFVPQLLLQRTTKTNVIRKGAVMFRYAKGRALSKALADWQSAGIFGFMRTLDVEGEAAEKQLCVTLDAQTGKVYPAPGKSVYMFNEMKAACASIAERWPAIKPPHNAIL
jgi:hypothetical protein